ncbi:SchA/CurD-like domain-containing protein [Streptomyces xiaopingdaonensis]|uniref:SchA/CurD-like domain-containing protein n=1 Tax=Streptomyces xiaopingdaonensis TaxID=1565415 RepID=UPI0002E59399|nr:SchA/CurD-like domain-containing protein [Streptomyces xiaopingdaonensis]
MSTWHALFYPLLPGSEEKVKELFRKSGRPQFDITGEDGAVQGRLLGTMAFVGKEMAVRVIEIEGPLPMVAAHMSQQPAVREFERGLEEHLAAPRDMTTREGAQAFFRQAALEMVLSRRHDQPLAGE